MSAKIQSAHGKLHSRFQHRGPVTFLSTQNVVRSPPCNMWLPKWLSGKNPPANAGDVSSIPGSVRSLGEGNGNLLQYSCQGNLMDRGAQGATVSQGRKRVQHDLATKQPQTTISTWSQGLPVKSGRGSKDSSIHLPHSSYKGLLEPVSHTGLHAQCILINAQGMHKPPFLDSGQRQGGIRTSEVRMCAKGRYLWRQKMRKE